MYIQFASARAVGISLRRFFCLAGWLVCSDEYAFQRNYLHLCTGAIGPAEVLVLVLVSGSTVCTESAAFRRAHKYISKKSRTAHQRATLPLPVRVARPGQ